MTGETSGPSQRLPLPSCNICNAMLGHCYTCIRPSCSCLTTQQYPTCHRDVVGFPCCFPLPGCKTLQGEWASGPDLETKYDEICIYVYLCVFLMFFQRFFLRIHIQHIPILQSGLPPSQLVHYIHIKIHYHLVI